MTIDEVIKVVAAVLGMGWLTTAAAWKSERDKQQKQVGEYLREKREQLDKQPALLAVIGTLRAEHKAARDGDTFNHPVAGSDARQLVAFLEPIGTMLLKTSVVPRDAFDEFADETLLCDGSIWLWADEGEPYSNTYWSSFKKFAAETRRRNRAIDIPKLEAISQRNLRQSGAS